jgi:hypothetical protein
MSFFKVIRLLPIVLIPLFYLACSDEKPEPKQETQLPPTVEKQKPTAQIPSTAKPVVYIEELDQFQEYFKEQHETSFSHVTKKNWTSYTAGKDGILTKVLLFGKPNYTISEHYGSSMSGFVRADNPDTGPKYGEWSISREEIVNQLALQGLTEIDRGWITLQMRGEIPQQAGRMYFIVCDQISDKRAWFGAFAFAEGNSYKNGRFWLHPEHDLVFRTYVGKTADQLEREQRGQPLFDSDTASLVPAQDIPAAPKPMIELSRNFEASPTPQQPAKPSEPKQTEPVSEEPLYQPATKAPKVIISEEIVEETEKVETEEILPASQLNESTSPANEGNNSQLPQRSLFERFFKNQTE